MYVCLSTLVDASIPRALLTITLAGTSIISTLLTTTLAGTGIATLLATTVAANITIVLASQERLRFNVVPNNGLVMHLIIVIPNIHGSGVSEHVVYRVINCPLNDHSR
jgi:hypothetical protein